jgi:hypothetical protein
MYIYACVAVVNAAVVGLAIHLLALLAQDDVPIFQLLVEVVVLAPKLCTIIAIPGAIESYFSTILSWHKIVLRYLCNAYAGFFSLIFLVLFR